MSESTSLYAACFVTASLRSRILNHGFSLAVLQSLTETTCNIMADNMPGLELPHEEDFSIYAHGLDLSSDGTYTEIHNTK